MTPSAPLRLALWSCPRTVSTTLMRSFDSRDDSCVVDEPFYAHYLEHTGLAHPMAEEIKRAHESDWRKVVDELLAPQADGVRVYYQKHMAHHLLAHMDAGYRDWMGQLTHAFLIRDPGEMLTSLLEKLPDATLEDTAYPQLEALFQAECERRGERPAVIDARDLLENPKGMLRALCAAVGIPFQDSMLRWSPGPRATDGVWGPHWYGNTLRSAEFAPYRPKTERVPAERLALLDACRQHYAPLHEARLRPA